MCTTLLAPIVAAVSAVAPQAPEGLELAALFSDHMVVQRDAPIPVWGWAQPGQRVAIRLGGEAAAAVADEGGRWAAKLDALPAGGPHRLVVEAGRRVEIEDVLIGEVWLASGQSNMAMSVRSSKDFDAEKAAADRPLIRMFTVKRQSTRDPQARCAGEWQVCSPSTVGAFSAAAYFFGRRVQEELDVPVGLINSSWGGTAVEAWTSIDVQRSDPQLEPVLAPWRTRVASFDAAAAKRRHERQLAGWREASAKAKAAGKKAPRRPSLQRDPALDPNHPANLFNGMIAPLVGYGIRGAIWYQGERNARTEASATLYGRQLPLMIADWRARWGQGDFPFAWVQLPNFKQRSDDPNAVSAWALIRESMLRTLAVPNTGMAITIDVGEANNIHPKDKQDVGERLAHWALADVYGRDVAASGPLLGSSRVDGDRVVVSFRHAEGGLRTSDGAAPRGFALAGPDGTYRWADATIDGTTVIVHHDDIPRPAAVRYAWADNPDCNLVNAAGLPASPFRTDPRR